MTLLCKAWFSMACAMALSAGCETGDFDDEPLDETVMSGDRSAQDDVTIGSKHQAATVVNLGFLPHNQTLQYRASNGCTYGVQHGNYLAAAYSKGWVNGYCTMMVMVTALQNGSLVDRGTKRFGSADGWQQAQVDFASIVGTTVIVVTGSRKKEEIVRYAGI